jgi:dTDP-4-dehydrorhamnose 3,5-epimerase
MLSYNQICGFNGLYILEPKKFLDDRGYFQELFNKDEFENYTNIKFQPVQENESSSKAGVVRGLHFQKGDFEQAKLVKCFRGAIIDVALDLRKDSFSYGKLFSTVLSEKNNKQLFIPRGYAHGFIALDENTDNVIRYLTDNPYSPNDEDGVLFDSEYLNLAFKNAICDEFPKGIAEKFLNYDLTFSEKDLTFKEWDSYYEKG